MGAYNHQQDSFNGILNVHKGSLGLATIHKLEGLTTEEILQKIYRTVIQKY